MVKLTTTTQGLLGTLFKAYPESFIECEWEHFRIPFNSFRKEDRNLKPICFKHSVGNVELIVYSSCVPEYLDPTAVRKSDFMEMPYYLMSTNGFHFDYKGKNHKLGNIGAICVVIQQGGNITYCKPLKYSGNIAKRLAANPNGKKSCVNRFNEILEEAWAIALPMFQKEQKRIAKKKVA